MDVKENSILRLEKIMKERRKNNYLIPVYEEVILCFC